MGPLAPWAPDHRTGCPPPRDGPSSDPHLLTHATDADARIPSCH